MPEQPWETLGAALCSVAVGGIALRSHVRKAMLDLKKALYLDSKGGGRRREGERESNNDRQVRNEQVQGQLEGLPLEPADLSFIPETRVKAEGGNRLHRGVLLGR